MNYLHIGSFKCFTDKIIPINNLTVFAGANGNGKSTAIQALLFLRRTIELTSKLQELEENDDEVYYTLDFQAKRIELNGAYCLSLGNNSFIIPRNTSPDNITIGLKGPTERITYHYRIGLGEDLFLGTWGHENNLKDENIKGILNKEFYYLNAERIGPRINQGIKFYDFPNAGYQGEFVAQLISDTNSNYKFEIEIERRNSKFKSPRLEQQVNAWLNDLMPGVSISAKYDPLTHAAQITVDNYYTKGNATIATNIGFGISYVLPIIVTGLIAKKGSFMIVENPEAHLHPSAQSKIGKFLAMVASAGVNVIIETHSDHVINGIQIATALKTIDSKYVTINFFSESAESNQPNVESISIKDNGELTYWPKGFFDQSQKDFAELFNIRKG